MSSIEQSLQNITQILRNTVRIQEDIIPLHEPFFGGNEWNYVKQCLDTGWVSSVGQFVDEFEKKLAEFVGAKRAVAVVNGTAALHICLKLVGVEANDEVLIPSLTFVATTNAVTYCGAVPHFVDSCTETLGLDPVKLEEHLNEIAVRKDEECYNKHTGRRIKAVIPMHTFGHPVDLDPLIELCRTYHIELVEDAAESLGSYYKDIHTGTLGKIAALSFNGNKIITTGGGGAIVTNDEELGRRAKHITTTAKAPHRWEFYHDQVGYNYRMPNLNAALGCAQLEQLPRFLAHKRNLAAQYESVFAGIEGVSIYREPAFARSNYWLNVLLLEGHLIGSRDQLLEITNHIGLLTRPVWTLCSKLPMFHACPSMDLTTSESLEQRIINIPSSVRLGG